MNVPTGVVCRGHLCKHFLFAMMKVIDLSEESPLAYQSAYLPCEVEGIIEQCFKNGEQILTVYCIRISLPMMPFKEDL